MWFFFFLFFKMFKRFEKVVRGGKNGVKWGKMRVKWLPQKPQIYTTNGFRETYLGIDLITNAFRGSIEKPKAIFDIFFIYFLFHHLIFRKTEGVLFLFTLKG